VLCGSRDAHLVTDRQRFDVVRDVVRCDRCGLVYLHPLFTPEEEQRLYESEYRDIEMVPGEIAPHEARRFFEHELAPNEQRVARVAADLRATDVALEVGSAAGSFLHQLRPRVAHVEGIELHQGFSAFAREELGLVVHDRPLEQLALPAARFDKIFVWHTLEHLRDPVAFLRTAAPLLRPEGRLYIELPNVDDALLTVYRLPAFRAFYFQPAHSYYFSPPTMRAALERAGLRPDVRLMQRYSVLNHLSWIARGRPQPDPSYAVRGPLGLLDSVYRAALRATGRADTLFAIGTRAT
jgi:2-polyprenyl-3-methyl-5-hydroxy-6-metoxy-1,4-benzoquinol methylase